MSYTNKNREIRKMANIVTKQNIGRILLMFLAVFGVVLAATLVIALLASLLSIPAIVEATDKAARWTRNSRYSTYTMFDALSVDDIIPGIIIMCAGMVGIGMLSMGLSMGLTNGMIRMARGERVPVTVIFSRVKNCFTGFGLSWWLGVKFLLWALPAVIPVIIGAGACGPFGSNVPLIVGAVVGFIVMFICWIMAGYRYAMSTYFIADEPRTGTFSSVVRSKQMMNGRKFQLFALTLPYILISLAISLVTGLITAALGFLPRELSWLAGIVGFLMALISMVASLFLSMFSTMAQARFYVVHAGELASADYKPLYRLTMHNAQIRKHSRTTVNMNVGKLLAIDIIYGAIFTVATLVVGLIIGLTGALASNMFNDRDTVFIGVIIIGVVSLIMSLVLLVVINGLTLGFVNARIKMARGELVPISTLFSRMRNGFGGIGLSIWVGLKTFLWMLPGLAVMGVSAVGLILLTRNTAAYFDESSMIVFAVIAGILSSVGAIMMIVMVIRAVFNYAMSTYVYADKPENGVFSAVEQSKWMMHESKMQYFRLQWPFMFVAFGILLVLAVFFALGYAIHEVVGAIFLVIASILYIVAMVYISYLSSVSVACFYTKYNRWDMAAADARKAAAQVQQPRFSPAAKLETEAAPVYNPYRY